MATKPGKSGGDWRLFRRLLRYVLPHRAMLGVTLFASLGVAALGQSFPFLQRMVIDDLLQASTAERLGRMGRLAAVYVAIALIYSAFVSGFEYALVRLAHRVIHGIRAQLIAKLYRLPHSFFDRTPVGSLVTAVNSDVLAMEYFITGGLVRLLQAALMMGAIVVYLLYLSWHLALIAFVALPALFVTMKFFKSRIRGALLLGYQRVAQLNGLLNELITGMSIVQLFNVKKRMGRDFAVASDGLYLAHLNVVRQGSSFGALVNFSNGVVLAVIVFQGGTSVLDGALTIGTLFAFWQYVGNFFQPLTVFSELSQSFHGSLAAAERIFQLLDRDEAITDPPAPRRIEKLRGEIELDGVWFAYRRKAAKEPTEEDWVLRGVDLRVKAGETVGVVGATGAGKTSLVGLIARFYDVDRGVVRVDGVDVRQYAQRELRRHVSVVPQEVVLFQGTIESTLRLNDPSINRSRIVEACRHLDIHDWIESLPSGYDTVVRERGAGLSMGQRQLLALARTFVRNPNAVLALDEATANIDTETEALIQRALVRFMAHRTCLIIAHRLVTVRHVDRVIVMRKGRVVEIGKHAELLASGGYYSKLCELQFGVAGRGPDAGPLTVRGA